VNAKLVTNDVAGHMQKLPIETDIGSANDKLFAQLEPFDKHVYNAKRERGQH
jgi:hypothetical protein